MGKLGAFQKTWRRCSPCLEQHVSRRNVRLLHLSKILQEEQQRICVLRRDGHAECASMEIKYSSESLWVLHTRGFLSKTHRFCA